MRSPAPRAWPALAALALLPWIGGGIAVAQEPGETGPADVAELVNALLAGLMGSEDMTPAQLQEEVAQAGGLAFRRDVPLDFLGREELRLYLQELLEAEYPRERAEADERLLEALDLWPDGTSLRAERARLLEENVVGFYDERPGRRRLYAVSPTRTLTPMNQIVLAHELRHAQQDQYEDLHAKVGREVSDFDDRKLAYMALLEGDATLVMERFLGRRLGLPLSEETWPGLLATASPTAVDVPGAPAVLRDQLLQPYLIGHAFARALWARGGGEAMRGAWHSPPETTEQVLHPERFFAGESARPVRLGEGARGVRVLSEGVLGELLLRTLLEGAPAEATEGWGGDAWRLYDASGRTLLQWTSVWDTPTDGEEFLAALHARFSRYPAREAEGGWRIFEAGRWRFAVRPGGGVEFVSSDDAVLLEAALGPVQVAEGTTPLDRAREEARVGGTDADPPPPVEAARAESPGGEGGAMASPRPGGTATNLGVQPNIGGLLCYVPCCIGLVFSIVVAVAEKQSRFLRFHAFQSLLLHAGAIGVGIALNVLNILLGVVGMGAVALLVTLGMMVVGAALLALTVFMMIKANAGEEFELPVVGPLARRWA